MRILLCCPHQLDRKRGAPKVWIEFAETLRELKHDVALISREERLPANLQNFEVVEIDHEAPAFDRSKFPESTLVVARSVLLVQHLDRIALPHPSSVRAIIGGVLRSSAIRTRIDLADGNLRQVDLINVSNFDDQSELIARGFHRDKITVQPFGLTAARRKVLWACPLDPPANPAIAFVGTFDYRKGALDLPIIFDRISRVIPNVELHLLGTTGLMRSSHDVLKHFANRSRVRVIETFEPEELPALLGRCSVGVFPSYYEGFGFGIIEMLAAALPVVGYDAPGPPMMLPRERLLRAGDVNEIADKLIGLLRSPRLRDERIAVRESTLKFDWREIAQNTVEIYQQHLARR